jgi:hypothetical protein
MSAPVLHPAVEPSASALAVPEVTLLDVQRHTAQGIEGGQLPKGVTTAATSKPRVTATGTLDATSGEPVKWICRAVVAESDVPAVAVGQPVRLVLDAFPKQQFEGRVAAISDKMVTRDNVTTCDVVIDIQAPDRGFKVGMTVNAEFRPGTPPPAAPQDGGASGTGKSIKLWESKEQLARMAAFLETAPKANGYPGDPMEKPGLSPLPPK